VVIAVAAGPLLSAYSPTDMDFLALLAAPSWKHPFGTDSFGRDVLTRILYGARVSMLVSAAGVLLAVIAGTAAGLLCAHFGRWFETVVMRAADLLLSFPSFVLALFLMVVLGFSIASVTAAITLVYLPIFARLSRNMAAVVKDEPWVQAARLFGQPLHSILGREILPNIAAPILVQAATGVAFGIVIEAGLSFLGLGVQPPSPSLGSIMADGREYFSRAPWVLTMTGAGISIALLGLNLLSDGIRDLMDPKLRSRL
ncbi:MAG: ABC transporter permease, partial [Bradyrhizobium sp.]|uniref:ABC transporter permease n=1 Tax=Bradyrhizobium sp. TaxID=376 RepID=UPI001DFCDC80